MKAHNISPNLIFMTNLVHISFYNRKPYNAVKIFNQTKEMKIKTDSLFYSKIISGLIKFKKKKEIPKIIRQCIRDKCGLNDRTLDLYRKIFHSADP